MSINVCNNNSMSAITSLPSGVGGGSLNLISTQTASSSATISFTSGIDSTYDEYMFKFINIHPATDNVQFQFNGSSDSGSNYNVTKTTTFFSAYNLEDDSARGLSYDTSKDLAQGTGFQDISYNTGNDNDVGICGTVKLFNPSSTTFVKHFLVTMADKTENNASGNRFIAGYFNTTSAINGIQFKFGSGNIDSGVIKLYGIS